MNRETISKIPDIPFLFTEGARDNIFNELDKESADSAILHFLGDDCQTLYSYSTELNHGKGAAP